MRTRFAPLILILVVVVSLALAGCERDRPAPATETGTPGASEPLETGTAEEGTVETLGTPVPLDAASPTPALLRPAATATEPPESAAAAATPSQPAAGSAGGGGTYTIQRGDSLGSIAEKFGVTTAAILTLNPGITNPDVLVVGQEVKLPAGPSVSAPASSGEGSGQQVHVVQRGETLSSIARRYGVTVAAMQQANNLANPDQIIVGQRLAIPAGASAAPAAPAGQARSYTVRRGDTMSSIAVRFGVTVAALQNANGITNPDKITVGQVLKIP
jgi:LysM repeat protein